MLPSDVLVPKLCYTFKAFLLEQPLVMTSSTKKRAEKVVVSLIVVRPSGRFTGERQHIELGFLSLEAFAGFF